MSTSTNLAVIQGDIYGAQTQFENVLSDRSINFEREAGFAIQLLGGNDYAMKTAMANRQSVVNAVVNVAAIGISLNPAKKQAYLVPRDGKICLDISYMGLLDLAIQSGSIMWGQAEIVHDGEDFELNGFDKPPTHKRNPFAKTKGAIAGAYSVVKTRDGDYLTTCMSVEDIYDIRNRSSAWKSGRACPWKTDEGEMIKKTVIKRAYKMWPKTDRLDGAVHYLNSDGGEGLHELAQSNSGPIVSPTASEVITPNDRKQIIRGVADAVLERFEADDIVGAYGEAIGIEDAEEKIELWRMLPSGVRTALKKHDQQLTKETA